MSFKVNDSEGPHFCLALRYSMARIVGLTNVLNFLCRDAVAESQIVGHIVQCVVRLMRL